MTADARYRPISGSNEPLRRNGHSRILGHMEPLFLGGRGGRRGSVMAPFERAVVVSRLSSVVTIWPQLRPNVSDAQINRGWVTLGQNFRVFLLEQTTMFGSAESEHLMLTNFEIISEEFQPRLCDHNPPTSQTDRRTDRQTTCDRKTALCTKVHRAVIKRASYAEHFLQIRYLVAVYEDLVS